MTASCFCGINDKLEYVKTLWDRMAAESRHLPVPGWHKDVIRERLAEEDHVDDTRDWDHVLNELRRELKKKSRQYGKVRYKWGGDLPPPYC